MSLLLTALAIWILGGGACLLAGRRRAAAAAIGGVTAVAGSVAAIAGGVRQCLSGGPAPWQVELPWNLLAIGHLQLACDGMAAFFLVVAALVTALAAIYGAGYLRHAPEGRPFGLAWCLYNLLTASMVVVFLADNALLFLLSWEIMALTSFGLVMFDHERPSVRRAGFIYFVATHLGTALLFVMFLLLGRAAHGSLDFADFRGTVLEPGLAGTVFVLALIGFGTKAGLMPMHVWLPEARPAAPSHVSAVMSGVMIKTGIYGILRIVSLLGAPPVWWGWTLVAAGCVSGVVGVLFALAQRDLKRLLAYSSVENIGVICLGLGVGMLGSAAHLPVMAVLGFSGALLHVLNHALFKSLLFLGAGAVLQAAGTAELNRLGGLLRRMPVTGNTFLCGAVAIAGLPPCNGFAGEMLILLGALTPVLGAAAGMSGALTGGLAAAVSLALIGALAVACFVNAVGTAFLGEPRDAAVAAHVHEAGICMRLPMTALAAACLALGLATPALWGAVAPAVRTLLAGAGMAETVAAAAAGPLEILTAIAGVAAGVWALALLLCGVRARLLRGRTVGTAVTWDCGYAARRASMQYTASSFARPMLLLVRWVVQVRRRFTPPQGLFPAQSEFASETPDVYQERLYRPLFARVEALLGRVHWMQHGRLNYYILAIVLALLAVLFWKMS